MESFAFPAKINSISTEILRKCSKLYFFSLESLEYSFLCFGLVLKEKCINQKAKPHKPSLVVGLQNGIWVLGLSCFVSEEFDNNDTPYHHINPLICKTTSDPLFCPSVYYQGWFMWLGFLIHVFYFEIWSQT